MFSVKVQSYFSSAHNLKGYKGKCEDLHGHNWKVEVEAENTSLDKTGMLVDFKALKKDLNSLLDKLDHKYLNKILCFKKNNPTSENIAAYIYKQLKTKCRLIRRVTVWESRDSAASYYEQ